MSDLYTNKILEEIEHDESINPSTSINLLMLEQGLRDEIKSLEAENTELKAKYEKLELMYAEALQAEINWSVQEALDYIREEMANE